MSSLGIFRVAGTVVLFGMFVGLSSRNASAQDPGYQFAPYDSTWHIEDATPWSMAFETMFDHRDIEIGERTAKLKALTLRPVLGYQPNAWLLLEGGMGTAQAKVDGESGDRELAWMLRLRVNFLEHILAAKPGIPEAIFLRGGLLVSVAGAHSRFEDSGDDGRIRWREWRIIPHLHYGFNLLRDGYHDAYEPASVLLRAGPMISAFSGKYRDGETEDTNVEESHTLGLHVGADLMLATRVTLSGEVNLHADGDYTMSFRAGYRF